MAIYDIVIKDGIVVDGAGNQRRRADVGIVGTNIAKIGRIDDADAIRVIDATGLIVAPGFIDLHTHYDAQIFWDPYLTTSGWHGVTSVVTGNCGFGFAPVLPELRERSMLSMTAVEAIPCDTLREGLPWDWVTFPEYLDSIDRTPKAINILPYVPLNPLFVWVLGLDAAKAGKQPTDAENEAIARLFDEAMDAGACGWSAQCLGQPGQPDARLQQGDFDGTPMPTDVMWPSTRMTLAEVLGRRGEGFMQMSGTSITDEEYESLVERSGRPLLWNAVIANTKTMLYRQRLAWLERCRAKGLPIYGQAMTTDPPIPFTFRTEGVLATSPLNTVREASTMEDKLAVLRDPAWREELRAFRSYAFNNIPDMSLMRTNDPDWKAFEGMTLSAIAEKCEGMDAVDVMCELSIADRCETTFVTQQFSVTLDGLRELIDDPYLIPGLSDGGAHVSFLSAGMYGTEYIVRYVRDLGFTTLEQAHWRLSGLPAHCAGFHDRGVLREGAAADIIVYDLDELAYLEPELVNDLPAGSERVVIRARGYRYTLVNGQVTIENDTETNAMSGQLLRHGRAAKGSVTVL